MKETELTEAELILTQEQEAKLDIQEKLDMARKMDNLSKDRDFIDVFTNLYIEQGKQVLWENIRHLEELNLKSFNEGRAKTIEKLKGEVKSRLDLESFIDLIISDGEAAEEETQYQDEKEEV